MYVHIDDSLKDNQILRSLYNFNKTIHLNNIRLFQVPKMFQILNTQKETNKNNKRSKHVKQKFNVTCSF